MLYWNDWNNIYRHKSLNVLEGGEPRRMVDIGQQNASKEMMQCIYIYILYKTTFWWYTPIIYDKVWGCFYYFWLVGTFCPYIGNSNPKWRTHIFQRGWHHQPVVLLTMGMTSLWKYGSEFPSELFVQSPKRRLGRKCFSAPPGTTKKQQRKHTHTRWCPIVI